MVGQLCLCNNIIEFCDCMRESLIGREGVVGQPISHGKLVVMMKWVSGIWIRFYPGKDT